VKHQKRTVQAVALVGITVVVFTWLVLAQDCPELVGRWPYGPAYAVAVSGTYAPFGSGTVLMVADASDSAGADDLVQVSADERGWGRWSRAPTTHT